MKYSNIEKDELLIIKGGKKRHHSQSFLSAATDYVVSYAQGFLDQF
ncbi:hypothetical protein [Apilactobacillus kunkeei]|nr:hypothetical protein [Apilactobacillus kunkeei]